jgi:hypothetical protein
MGSATSEWITERPLYIPATGSPYFSDLANFGTVSIASAYSQPALSAFPAATDPADDPSQAPVSQTMTDNGTVLADPGSFRDQTAFPPPAPSSYNGGFPINWFNCQTTGTGH